MEKAFGSTDETAILSEILQRGELQVGEKEREAALLKMRKETASSLAGMSVNPATLRPYPVTLIEKVMKDVHFKLDPKKAAKTQAKELLELLAKEGQLPIQRAKMRLKISVPVAREAALRQGLEWEEESRAQNGDCVETVVLILPGLYRQVEEAAKRENATVVVVSLAVTTVAAVNVEHGGNAVSAIVAQKESSQQQQPSVEVAEAKLGKMKIAEAPKTASKRAQKEEQRFQGLMGVVEDDDDDWKDEKKKKGGGRKKKGK